MSETYQVRLDEISGDVDRVVEAVQDTTGLDTANAKRVVETRGVVKQGVDQDTAAELRDRFESANATVSIETTQITSATTPHFEPPTPPEDVATVAAAETALRGRLVDARNPELAIPDAAVVAFAADSDSHTSLGSTVTNENGTFVIESFGATVAEQFPDTRPEVEFNAFVGDDELELSYVPFDWDSFGDSDNDVTLRAHATSDGSSLPTTQRTQTPAPNSPTNSVSAGNAVVRGTVRFGEETYSGATVRAFDRDLREERLIGETVTDEHGQYEIWYDSTEGRREASDGTDLMVRVLVGEEVVLESDVYFDAKTQETIDLRAPASARPTEYDGLQAVVSRATDNVALSSLSDSEVQFLVREIESGGAIELSPERVQTLVAAARRAETTPFQVADLYALKRTGVAVADEALAKIEPQHLQDQLEAAVEEEIIPKAVMNRAAGRLNRALTQIADRPEDDVGTTIRVVDEQGTPLPDFTLEVGGGRSVTGEAMSEGSRHTTSSSTASGGETAGASESTGGEPSRPATSDTRTESPISRTAHAATTVDFPIDGGVEAVTGDDGMATIEEQPVAAAVSPETATVRDPQGGTVRITDVSTRGDQVTVHVSTTPPGVSGDVPIPELGIDLGLSEELASALADVKLTDIRAAGGIRNLGIEGTLDSDVADLMDSLANLTLVTAPTQAKTLYDAGYVHLVDIAAETPDAFTEEVGSVLGPSLTHQIHAKAVASVRMLDGIVTERRTRWANARHRGGGS